MGVFWLELEEDKQKGGEPGGDDRKTEDVRR